MSTYIRKLKKIIDINKKYYILNHIWCFFCLIIYTVSAVMFPSFLSKIVDIGIARKDMNLVIKYALEMLLCGISMGIFYYLQKVSFFKFGNKIILDTRQRIYSKLCFTNIFFWNKYKVGDILTILDSDIEKLQDLLTNNISELIVNFFLAIGIAVYIFTLNIKIGIIVSLLAVFFAIFQKKISDKSKNEMKSLRDSIGDFNSYSTETINNMPSLQMTGKIDFINKIYSEYCFILASKGLRFIKTSSLVSVTGITFNVLAIILVLLIGAIDVSNNFLSVGVLFSLTIYVQRLYSPIITIGNLFIKVKNFSPILDNIYSVFTSEQMILNGTYKSDYRLNGKVEFNNVSFSYNDIDYVIKNYSDTFEVGDVVGIIGKNGSGKTTICRLLTKLCRCTSGIIKLDGINIDDFDVSYLQTQIGVMTQDSFLLSDEFNEMLKDQDIIFALQKYLDEMNFSTTGTLITSDEFKINENRINLSGGEAQKLALFKLYLDNKPICILDEPTASLDASSENKMIEFIKNNFNNKTLFIITHKPEILSLCTKTINFELSK